MGALDSDTVIRYWEQRIDVMRKEINELKGLILDLVDTEGNRLLTTAQAAKEASVSVNTIKNWCYDGSLDFEKPGGKILIRKKILLERIKKY